MHVSSKANTNMNVRTTCSKSNGRIHVITRAALKYKRDDDDIPPPRQTYEFPQFDNVPFAKKYNSSRKAMSTLHTLTSLYNMGEEKLTVDELADIIESKWGKVYKLSVRRKLNRNEVVVHKEEHDVHEVALANYREIVELVNDLDAAIHVRTAITSHMSFMGPSRDNIYISI